MNPLLGLAFLIVAGLIGGVSAGAASWVIVVFMIMLGLVVLTFIVVYCLCARYCPERLQSERYQIRVLELDRGLVGDSGAGMKPYQVIDALPEAPKPELPPPTSNPEGNAS